MQRGQLEDLVRLQRNDEIADAACRNRRVLSWLLALTYTPDDDLGWKAVWAMGQAAARVAEDDPEYIRGILRRLQWSLNDESGGIGWRSPAAMGAIVAASPGLFDEFAPIIASLLDMEEEHFYPGVLWAIGMIAPQVEDRIGFAIPMIQHLLQSSDQETRGMAVWALMQLGDMGCLDRDLMSDNKFTFFDGHTLLRVTPAQIKRNW
jgi:hypothetical protein